MKKDCGIFQSIEHLTIWLSDQSIELSKWNQGHAKSVENLFYELENGECQLQMHPPLRVVNVVQVLVTNGDLYLLELEQELEDKRKRNRNIPPSEKMKPNENCLDAARRCLIEELGVKNDDIDIKTKDCEVSIRYRKSRSFPGLNTKYYVFRVYAQVRGLSEENFWTEEITQKDGVEIVRRFCWGWSNLRNIKLSD